MTVDPATDTRSRFQLLWPLVLAGAAILVFAALLVGGGGGSDRRSVFVQVDEVANMVPGQAIRAGGEKVGEVEAIEAVDGGRAARVEIGIDDDAWPLTTKSRMTLRWGGTANFSNRYLALDRGPADGTPVEEGDDLAPESLAVPVEFDSLLRTFPERVRADVREFIDTAGPSLDAASKPLREVLAVSPPAVNEAAALLEDIDADQEAVHSLVVSADRVLGAVDRAQPGMRELLSGASGTFAALGGEARNLQEMLARTPGMLDRTRRTLARADLTLDDAQDVVARIAPGVEEVRRIAKPLHRVLGAVVRVGPDATSTLADLRGATPDLDPLLDRVRTTIPQLGSIGRQAVENLKCIRPYTPDAVAFFSNWGDFFSAPDGKDKLIRAQVQNYLPAAFNTVPYDSKTAKELFPGLEYGFPRPPGTNAGQPWFLPECGAGPDALDPAKDPEARPFSDVFNIPTLRKLP
jgi:phospholipid/cholesterol/gamma-HCH transport system substrate-binding protein